ncbi:MAG: AEC family transporter [Clostridium sp.]|nr:AEC family transporter [Clostridium sp.]MCM1208203.1 AEC family transporter [Ruminococcus sp.]
MTKALVPIIALILTGIFIKKIKFVSEETIAGIKNIASNVFLPAVIFNALATADFNKDSMFIFFTSLFVLVAGFSVGFVIKKLYKKPYRDYIPYMTVTFEGGMLGYALAQVLVGADKLYYIATIDLAGALFGFTVWITMLERLCNKNSREGQEKGIVKSILTTPTLIAAVLGLIFGLTGLGHKILGSGAGEVYENVVEMFSAPLTPLILISLGYGIRISKETIKDALLIILERICVVGLVAAIAFLLFGRHISFTPALTASFILYFCLPPSFILSVYVKEEKSRDVVSCVLSLYMILTLAVFCVLLAKF